MNISSMKQYRNQLNKINHEYGTAVTNKNYWKAYYMDMFIDLAINSIEWHGLPKGIDPYFLERACCFVGFGGMGFYENYGFLVQRGAMGNKLNLYYQPTDFIPTPPPSFKLEKKEIAWYNDIEEDPNKAIIIPNTQNYQPSIVWLDGLTTKLAEIEQLIQTNRNAQATPYIIVANEENLLDMKTIFNKTINGEPVIYLKEQKDITNTLAPVQLKDRVTVLDLKAPYLLDKLSDEKDRLISQALTNLGLNSIAIDKAERLTSAEATSNNGLIQAMIQRRLQPRNYAVNLMNHHFKGLLEEEISVSFNSKIQSFNIEQTNEGEQFDNN